MSELTKGEGLFDPQDDAGLQTQINELNRAITIIERPTTSLAVIKRTISNVEARLISIITQVSTKALDHPQGLDPYALWLVANRREIVNNMNIFDNARSRAAFPRDGQSKRQLAESYDEVREHFRDTTRVYGNFTRDLRAATSKYYAAVTGASAATATGLSGLSIFGSPIVAAAVIPSVAAVGVVSTGVAAYCGDKEGERRGPIVAEEAIRAQYNPNH